MTPVFHDMIETRSARVVNSFADALAWPITVNITNIALMPGRGVVPTISGLERWPDFTPPGWTGPLRFTLWAGFCLNGEWVLSGFMQFWSGRTDTGANPLELDPGKGINQWQANWAYGGWGQLDAHVPQAGELMAFLVTAGDARYGKIETVRERSQVVTIPLAVQGSWGFAATDDAPTDPGPTPQPDPPVLPVPPSLTPVLLDPTQYNAIMARFDSLEHGLAVARADIAKAGTDLLKQLPSLLRKALSR